MFDIVSFSNFSDLFVNYLSVFFQNFLSPLPPHYDKSLKAFLFLTAGRAHRFKRSLCPVNVSWMSNFYEALVNYIMTSADLSNTLVTLIQQSLARNLYLK